MLHSQSTYCENHLIRGILISQLTTYIPNEDIASSYEAYQLLIPKYDFVMLNILPFSHVHPNNKLYDHIKGCSTGFLIEQGLGHKHTTSFKYVKKQNKSRDLMSL